MGRPAPTTRCGSLCPAGGPPLHCTLPHGHESRHQAGHFGWYEPVRVYIGGKLHQPNDDPVRFSWERDRVGLQGDA